MLTHDPVTPMQRDVRLHRRAAAGAGIGANIPYSVVCHSPSGWETGYGGSGPADLALNIVNAFIPPASDGEPVEIYQQGNASATAAQLYQPFKDRFLTGLHIGPGDTATLAAADIDAWIEHAAPGVLARVRRT